MESQWCLQPQADQNSSFARLFGICIHKDDVVPFVHDYEDIPALLASAASCSAVPGYTVLESTNILPFFGDPSNQAEKVLVKASSANIEQKVMSQVLAMSAGDASHLAPCFRIPSARASVRLCTCNLAPHFCKLACRLVARPTSEYKYLRSVRASAGDMLQYYAPMPMEPRPKKPIVGSESAMMNRRRCACCRERFLQDCAHALHYNRCNIIMHAWRL